MRKYISLLLAGAALICTSNVQAQKGPAPRLKWKLLNQEAFLCLHWTP